MCTGIYKCKIHSTLCTAYSCGALSNFSGAGCRSALVISRSAGHRTATPPNSGLAEVAVVETLDTIEEADTQKHDGDASLSGLGVVGTSELIEENNPKKPAGTSR